MFKTLGGVGLLILIIGLVPHPEPGTSAFAILIGAPLVGVTFGAIADALQIIGD